MTLIPEGQYLARVTSSALGYTADNKEQLAISFDIALPDGSAVTRTWYGFFTEKAEPITLKALEALGFNAGERSLTELAPYNPYDTPIAGAEARVKIVHDDYTGEMRDKIAFVNPKDGGGVALKERMDPAAAAEFAAKFRARVAGSRPPSAASAKPAQPNPAPKTSDEFGDIPF